MKEKKSSRALVQCGWKHARHLSPEAIKDMIATTPPHLLDARMNGNPTMGSGNVYPVPRAMIEIPPIQLQPFWKRIAGLDVGFKVTAAVFLAHDTDNDIVYVYDEYFGIQQNAATNASAMWHRCKDRIPIMIDPASRGRSQNDGTKLIMEYRKEGLDVRAADNAVEAGILAVWDRLSTGRMKIFSTCVNLLKEYELYRRDINGKIIKESDHGVDGLRYSTLGLRQAKFPQDRAYDAHEYKHPYKF